MAWVRLGSEFRWILEGFRVFDCCVWNGRSSGVFGGFQRGVRLSRAGRSHGSGGGVLWDVFRMTFSSSSSFLIVPQSAPFPCRSAGLRPLIAGGRSTATKRRTPVRSWQQACERRPGRGRSWRWQATRRVCRYCSGTVRTEGRKKKDCGCGPGRSLKKRKERKKGKRADEPSKEKKIE